MPDTATSPAALIPARHYAATLATPPNPASVRAVAGASGDLWREAGGYLLRLLAVVMGICAVMYGYQLLLPPDLARPYNFYFPERHSAYGVALLTAATLGRGRRGWMMGAVSLVCAWELGSISPWLLAWAAVLLPCLYWLLGPEDVPGRTASRRFWTGLGIGVVLLPKVVQTVVFHNAHGSLLDVNQNLFAGLFLRYAYYYYERRRGLVPAGEFQDHVAYLLFVPQITGMLNVPPAEMAARWGFGGATLKRGFAGVGWAWATIPAVLYLERRVLPVWGYERGYPALLHAPWWSLWACLLTSYLYWALLVSAKFGLMVAQFRFFGLNVDDNFHWPLLATSPVAVWRRWNVYNRRLLLKFVYFPLGGSRTHVYRNIVLTFLASALLLHTGFCGSPWWGLNLAQLRDWLLYFAVQGALVAAAYWWTNQPFWSRVPAVARVSLQGFGWAFTLASSAWLHVLPLAAGLFLNNDFAPIKSLPERLALMARALGLL